MASANGEGEGHARKRVKLEDAASTTTSLAAEPTKGDDMEKPKMVLVNTMANHGRERDVGILRWVNEENVGFEGVLKQRYACVAFLASFELLGAGEALFA